MSAVVVGVFDGAHDGIWVFHDTALSVASLVRTMNERDATDRYAGGSLRSESSFYSGSDVPPPGSYTFHAPDGPAAQANEISVFWGS